MKKMLLTGVLIILTIAFIQNPVSAITGTAGNLREESADILVKFNLLKGYDDGSLKLNNMISRCEFFSIVVRMMGYENNNGSGSTDIFFSDLDKKHWSYNSINLAVKNGLTEGYPDNTIAPDKPVIYAEALTVLIRALGYENTLNDGWPQNVVDKSVELGLNKGVDLLPDKQLTRGDVAVLIVNSLTVDYNK